MLINILKKCSEMIMTIIIICSRTEFSIDMIAEYDWPHNESTRNRETYMIQEQIAEYLGVKSFKRKYPDLMRRPVDMEERNFLFENGLASEKMCDLGLTAVFAGEVLDIMCSDYPEKYEEYKRYQREKVFRHARLRLETAVIDRSQMQKDKAISSASDWNTKFNKECVLIKTFYTGIIQLSSLLFHFIVVVVRIVVAAWTCKTF
jgi:hypothetical protein